MKYEYAYEKYERFQPCMIQQYVPRCGGCGGFGGGCGRRRRSPNNQTIHWISFFSFFFTIEYLVIESKSTIHQYILCLLFINVMEYNGIYRIYFVTVQAWTSECGMGSVRTRKTRSVPVSFDAAHSLVFKTTSKFRLDECVRASSAIPNWFIFFCISLNRHL